jgi:hypothetical protein
MAKLRDCRGHCECLVTDARGGRARCPLSRVSLGRAGILRDAVARRLHPLLSSLGGGCWHCRACASSGHPRRCQPRMAIPARPALFPLRCVCCFHSHSQPSNPVQKKQNTKRSCSIALSSSFRIPYSPRRSDKRRSFFLRLHSSALAWKDPLGASPFISFAHCSEMQRKTKSSLCRDSSQFTLWFRLIRNRSLLNPTHPP